MTAPLHLSVRPGSEKARIWAICDALLSERGAAPSGREVVDRYVAEGGNEGTGFTQYSHWKKAFKRRRGAEDEGLAEAPAPVEAAPSEPVPSEPAPSEPVPPPAGAVGLVVEPDGSMRLPRALLEAAGLTPGSRALATAGGGALRVGPVPAAILRIQNRMAKYKKPGVSVVDEFLAERRALWGEEEE